MGLPSELVLMELAGMLWEGAAKSDGLVPIPIQPIGEAACRKDPAISTIHVHTYGREENMMERQLVRVSVGKFREELANYLNSPTAVAITRHGQTVGYYIPAGGRENEHEVLMLRHAAKQLEALLAERGVSEDEVVREFGSHRSQG